MHTIHSFDGGGVLACGPIRFMARYETRNWPSAYAPDRLVGTSSGGLIAILRATGMPWVTIESTFNYYAPRIFAKAPWWWRFDPTRPKYQTEGLKRALDVVLKGRLCCDVDIPFMVTSFDYEGWQAKIIDETDGMTLAEAIMRTAAAPGYFAPHDNRWLDGALVANNPAAIGILGAHRRGIPLEQIRCLSLATGGEGMKPSAKISNRMLKVQWAEPAIECLLGGNERVASYQAQSLIGPRFLRVLPKISRSYPIDDLSIMPAYKQFWDWTFDAYKATLDSWFEQGA